MSDIGLFEAMYSARALRRLKPDPVPDEVITKILDAAIRAPSAGNSQHWAFVVVRDSEMRRKLGLIYRKGSDIAKAIYQARGRPVHMTDEQYQRMMSSGAYLWEHMGDAPVCWCRAYEIARRPRAKHCRRRCKQSTSRSLSTPNRFAAPASIPLCRISFWPAAPSASVH